MRDWVCCCCGCGCLSIMFLSLLLLLYEAVRHFCVFADQFFVKRNQ